MQRTIKRLEHALNSIRLPLGSEQQKIIDSCKYLVSQLQDEHRDEYKRIALQLDLEICGEIMRIEHGSDSNVIGYGTEAIKNIVFDEMGFTSTDRYHLTQH